MFRLVLINMNIELNSLNTEEILLQKVKKDIENIVKSTELYFQFTNTLSDFECLKKNFYFRISTILDKFKDDYCKKHNINVGNKKLERYSLKTLYQELEEIRKRYQLFYTMLENEYEKYTSYAGFNEVHSEILKIKNQTIDMFKFMFSKNINDDNIIKENIDTFNKKVLEIFEIYHKNIKIVNELKERYKDTKDLEIRKLLMETEKYVYDIRAFSYYITELEKHIRYEEEKSARSLAKPGIKKAYEKNDYNYYNFYNEYKKYIKEEFITDDYKIKQTNYKTKKRIK